MTFDEAMKAAKTGKAVCHPGMNTGWRVVWQLKSAFYTHAGVANGGVVAARFDERDKARTDWELYK